MPRATYYKGLNEIQPLPPLLPQGLCQVKKIVHLNPNDCAYLTPPLYRTCLRYELRSKVPCLSQNFGWERGTFGFLRNCLPLVIVQTNDTDEDEDGNGRNGGGFNGSPHSSPGGGAPDVLTLD